MASTPPRWDLSNVYPGLDSQALVKDINWVKESTESIRQLYQEKLAKVDASSSPKAINEALSMMVDKTNTLMEKAMTIRAYLHSFMATDSFNKQAMRMGSEFDQVMVDIQKVNVLLEAWVGQFKEVLPDALALGGSAGEHTFANT